MTTLDVIKNYVMDGERIGDMSKDRLIQLLYELGLELGYYQTDQMQEIIALGKAQFMREKAQRMLRPQRLN